MKKLFLFLLALKSANASQYVVLDALEDNSGQGYGQYLSHIPKEERVLITHEKTMTPQKREGLGQIFSSIHEIDNYFLSAALEVKVLDIHEKTPIKRIITNAVEEFDIVRAASLREHLDLKGQGYTSAEAFRNKVVMKGIVEKAGFKVPFYGATDCGLDLIKFTNHHGYPVIIKPRTGVGSIQTEVIKSNEECHTFLKTNYNCHYRSNFMVETFVNGHVYQVDGIFDRGNIFAWPSKYVNSCLDMALNGKVLGSHLLSASNPLTSKLIAYAEKLIPFFPNPKQMPFHLEVFVTDSEEIIFCEIASRVGGHVNNNWKAGLHIDLEQAFYDIQSGREQVEVISKKIEGPAKIPGWLLFPAKPSSTIENLPTECLFTYCTTYQPLMKNGDTIDATLGICSNLAKASILADSEEDFSEKANELMSWFANEIKYK